MRPRGLLALPLLLLGLARPASAAAEIVPRPVARGLVFPTNIAFAPDGTIFFTEKDTGRIRIIRDGRVLARPFAKLDVIPGGERGLLGIALHPEFPDEPWVYAYYSDPADQMNTLVRIRAQGDVGGKFEPLLDVVTATAGYHNGGDIVFGLDGMLYVAAGEAHDPARAQDPTDLGGKVLRLTPEGRAPNDNPFGPASPVYSLGHRNSFGLCVDPESGALWETENGPDEWDELNLIEPGGNYGWPEHLGPDGPPRFIDPVVAFERIIVPTGCAGAAYEGGLYFGDYQGNLHRVEFPGMGADDRTPRERVVASFDAGITDVAMAPGGALYVATADAIWLLDLRHPAGTPEPTQTPEASASPSPTPAAGTPRASSGGLTLVTVVIGALLVAALVAARRRLG